MHIRSPRATINGGGEEAVRATGEFLGHLPDQ
jgi:hypothetical protein